MDLPYYLPDFTIVCDYNVTVAYNFWHHARKFKLENIIVLGDGRTYRALRDNQNVKLTNANTWQLIESKSC